MGNWMTASEISQRFFVGKERLLSYSQRGNLPFRRTANDELLFDGTVVAQIFRPRQASIVSARSHQGPSLGVLGLSRIGDEPSTVSLSGREARRRALRTSRHEVMLEPARKAAG